jgi:hypothetical protein
MSNFKSNTLPRINTDCRGSGKKMPGFGRGKLNAVNAKRAGQMPAQLTKNQPSSVPISVIRVHQCKGFGFAN